MNKGNIQGKYLQYVKDITLVHQFYSDFWARGFKVKDHDWYMENYIPKRLHHLCNSNTMQDVYDLEEINFQIAFGIKPNYI